MSNSRMLILGILCEKPMHGYEAKKWLDQRRTQLWADVLPGSIYNALKSMTKEGLITVRSTEKRGNQDRTIYSITPQGREELVRLLRIAWLNIPLSFPTELYAALAFIDRLPRVEVSSSIATMTTQLQEKMSEWDDGETRKRAPGYLSELARVSFENGREHLETDIRFLRRLKRILESRRSN
jgi:DNA-binding PadR family transcriptional regulator